MLPSWPAKQRKKQNASAILAHTSSYNNQPESEQWRDNYLLLTCITNLADNIKYMYTFK